MSNATLQVLTEAYELLGRRRKWTRWSRAVDRNGRSISPKDPAAVRFCALGAIEAVATKPSVGFDAEAYLIEASEVLFGWSIVAVNDESLDDGYTKIRKAYRAAIKQLKTELGS